MTPPKIRIYELSKALGVSNAQVMEVLKNDLGVTVKSHSSSLDQDIADKITAHFKGGKSSNGKGAGKDSAAKKDEPKKDEDGPPEDVIPNLHRYTLRKAEKPAAPPPEPEKAPEATPPAAAETVKPDAPAAPPATPSAPAANAPSAPAAKSPYVPEVVGIRTVQANWPSPQARRPGAQPGQQQGRPGDAAAYARPQQDRPLPPGARPPGAPGRPGDRVYPAPTQQRPPQQQPPQQPQTEADRSSHGPRPGHGGKERERDGRSKMLEDGPQAARGGFARPAYTPQNQGASGSGRGGSTRSSRRQAEYEKIAAMRRQKEEEEAALAAQPKIARIDEPIVVRDLAIKLRLRDTELIKHLFMKGMMVTVNQTLETDFARSIAREFDFEVEETEKESVQTDVQYGIEAKKKLDESQFSNLQPRSPVISIMGHVDHGKTTLLDAIRETRHKVVDTEAGGITQSIGAYTVEKEGQRIVFLDTPGHEAFTSMRMRGAQATDIAILVVAADDGVMPQTKEAISHAKAAQIPIIIAVNKIDKADADPDRVLTQLMDYGLTAEKWGGEVQAVEVSALQKLGIDDLLDQILVLADLLEFKADPTVPGEGVIIEAQLDKRTGPIATALVQNGTMKVGDNVLIGSVGGRVRALIDDHGNRIQSAGPATPVEIMGLNGVPNAGEAFKVITDDKQFKQLLASAKEEERTNRLGVNKAALAGVSGPEEADQRKEQQFTVLVKADTQGSLEAVVEVLQRLSTDEVKINIVHSGTGDVTEADAMLASTANALVIAFNVKEDTNAVRIIEQQGVTVKKYDVIYHITEEMEKWVLGQLSPETSEVEVGSAEVRQIFKVGKNNVIAGCMVTTGKMVRNAKAVVLRNGKEIFSGTMDNLKRFKDDAKEVAAGYECGISFDRFNDLQEGDVITVFTTKQLERTSF